MYQLENQDVQEATITFHGAFRAFARLGVIASGSCSLSLLALAFPKIIPAVAIITVTAFAAAIIYVLCKPGDQSLYLGLATLAALGGIANGTWDTITLALKSGSFDYIGAGVVIGLVVLAIAVVRVIDGRQKNAR